MTTPVQTPPPVAERTAWLQTLHPVYRLILRWALIAMLTVIAFHESLRSLVETTRSGGLGGYAWTVPVAAILAGIGVARRKRTELPIHDRQTDVIVGIMGLVLALLLHGVLLQRYALYFHLLRLDLVALWLFIVSASVALFGLRPVTRFAWVWALLFMVFPLPYYILVVLLGASKPAAGVGTMVIAGVATGIAVGRGFTRGFLGSLAAWGVGLLIVAVMAVWFPTAPVLAFQMIPALTSICLVAAGLFFAARRGAPKQVLDRKIEPLAARQVWSAIPVVIVIAVALSFVRLPDLGTPPALRIDTLDLDRDLAPPAGWHVVDTRTYPWVTRLFGPDARQVRQKIVADTGDHRYDQFARPRTLVVDATTTRRPFSFNVYPARVLYHARGIRLSTLRPVDLGYGVDAGLVSAIDDELLVTWDALGWTWTNGRESQRVLIIAVDNHEDNAPFPETTGGVGITLGSLFTVLFRGNSAISDLDPVVKDDPLLVEVGHALVRAQLEPLGVAP